MERNAALDWAVRTSDPEFDDWSAFAAWITSDPAHGALYDQAMSAVAEAADAMAAEVVPVLPLPTLTRYGRRARAQGPARWRPLAVAGGAAAVAAGFAAAIILLPASPAPELLVIEAPVAASRAVALADGSRVVVAPGGRVTVDRSAVRMASLDRGRAMFLIHHDPTVPFRVSVNGRVLKDAGTAFEVVRQDDGVRVAVAEGAVIVDPDGRPLTLIPGQIATLTNNGDRRHVGRMLPDSIGAWRQERLSWRDAPLPVVADTVAAAMGLEIVVAPELRDHRFTGTLIPATLRDDPAALGPLLGAVMTRTDGGWELRNR